MGVVFSLLGLALPSLIARIFFRRDRSILGVLQDLFVGAQLGLISLLSPWIIPPIQLLILYDGWIDRALKFRLDGSCLSVLKQIGDFKDSAKALNIFKIFPLFIPLALLPLILNPLSPQWICLGLPFIYFKTDLVNDALLIFWEKQVLAFFSKRFMKKSGAFLSFAEREVLSAQEIYTFKNPHYPLFRYTHGFRGKKEIEIAIAPEEKPHILFLFVESLRAKDVGFLGGKHGVTSQLDAIAKDAHVFSNFYANSFPTFRSFYTSLFGLPYTSEMRTSLSKNIATYGLPQHLKELGYETNFFTGAHWGIGGIGPFLRQMQADRIFDKKEIETFNPNSTGGSWGIDDEYLFELFLDHFEKHQNLPQFYSALTITSHHPWITPKGYHPPKFENLQEGYYRSYLQTLHYVDYHIGRLVRRLKEKDLTKNLLLFITGDHGLYFGEDNEALEFRRGSHEENFHVPLMIYADGRIKEPKVIDTLASQCDFLPTVMDLLNKKGYQHSIGRSLIRKAKKPRIFFHNPADFTSGIFYREGDTIIDSNRSDKGIAVNFQKMLSSVYDKNLIVPPWMKREGKTLNIEPYRPPKRLSAQALTRVIYQNSPMTALILDENHRVGTELLTQIGQWNPDLDLLSLEQSYSVTDQGLCRLLKHCSHIHYLNLSDCPLLTEKSLEFLPKTLMRLYLQKLDFVNDRTFNKQMRHLEVLDIKETSITDQGFSRFPDLFPTLTNLLFSYIHLSMGSIQEVLGALPLYRLKIYDGQTLTDEDALELFKPHSTLRFLGLQGVHHLTDDLFGKIQECSLRHLYLSDIPNLTNRGLESLLKLPLDVLHITSAPGLSRDAFEIIDRYQDHFVDLSIQVINI